MRHLHTTVLTEPWLQQATPGPPTEHSLSVFILGRQGDALWADICT